MGHTSKNKKVGKSSKRMYGPRKLVMCGYSGSEQLEILALLEEKGLGAVPVVFATAADLQRTMKDVFATEPREEHNPEGEMSRATIVAGLTQKELHILMTAYRKAKLPPQLWAALTPTSESWLLSALLEELAAEQAEIRRTQQTGSPQK